MLPVSPVFWSNLVQMCSTQIRIVQFGSYNHLLSHPMFCKNQVVRELRLSLKGMAMISNQNS